jgi:hypothetical protein
MPRPARDGGEPDRLASINWRSMTALSTAAIAPLVIVGIFLEPYIVSRLRRVPGSSGEPLDEIKYGRSSRRTSPRRER